MIVSDIWNENVMILIIRLLLAQAFATTRNLTQKKKKEPSRTSMKPIAFLALSFPTRTP